MITFPEFKRQIKQLYPDRKRKFDNLTTLKALISDKIIYASKIGDGIQIYFLLDSTWSVEQWKNSNPREAIKGSGSTLMEAHKSAGKVPGSDL